VPFSIYDVALITDLPATRKLVLFECSEATGEVEELLREAMIDHVSCEEVEMKVNDERYVHI